MTSPAPTVGPKITVEREIALVPPLVERVQRQQRRDPLIVGGLVLAAALLRIPTLRRAYWVDEGISVGIASHRLNQIPGLLRMDGSPPLYYALLHFWVRAFGTSEVAAHLLPLLISLALVPLAWWSARSIFGDTAGLCAAGLAATNPFLAWYSTESRMYTLVCALTLVALTMAVRAVRDRSFRDAAWSVVALAALMYTHNWGLYLVMATGVVFAVHAIRNRDRPELLAVIVGGAALAVAYLPWLPFFLSQARNTAAPWAVRPSPGDLFADPASALGGTLGIVIGPLFIWGVVTCWTAGRAKQRQLAAVLVGIGFLTIIEGWVAAQAVPSWASRYLAVALAPLLIALAGILAPSRRGRRVVVGAVALLAAWSVVGSLIPDTNARYAKSNVAAVAGIARQVIHPGDLVVVTQSEQLAVVAHYLPNGISFSTPLGPVSDPHVVDWRHLTQRLAGADPCQTIAPQLAALPEGAQVFVVNPLKAVGASGSPWSSAVNGQVRKVNQLLMNDPGLHLVHYFGPATVPKPFSPVVGLLFVKGSGSALCG